MMAEVGTSVVADIRGNLFKHFARAAHAVSQQLQRRAHD